MCVIRSQFGLNFCFAGGGPQLRLSSHLFAGAMNGDPDQQSQETSSSSTNVEHAPPTRGRSLTRRAIDGNPTDHQSMAYGQIGLRRQSNWVDAMWQLAYGQINVSIKHAFVEATLDEWERERITKQRLRRFQTASGRIQTAPEIAAEHEVAAETAVAAEQKHPEWERQLVAREHEAAEETAVAAEQKPPEHQGEHEMPPLGCSRTYVDTSLDEWERQMVAREHEVALEQETAVAAEQEPPTRSKAEMNFRKRKQKRKQAIKRSTEKLELPPMPPPPGVLAAIAAEQKPLEH